MTARAAARGLNRSRVTAASALMAQCHAHRFKRTATVRVAVKAASLGLRPELQALFDSQPVDSEDCIIQYPETSKVVRTIRDQKDGVAIAAVVS